MTVSNRNCNVPSSGIRAGHPISLVIFKGVPFNLTCRWEAVPAVQSRHQECMRYC